MTAVNYDFTIEQGAKLAKRFQYNDAAGVPVPLTGFSGRMHIRENLPEATVLLDMTTANGKIVFETDGDVGRIDWVVGADETEAGTLDWASGVYDMEVIEDADPTNVIRLLEGKVKVSNEVTRQ